MLRAVYLNVDLFGGALGLSGIPERATASMIYGLLGLAVLALWLVREDEIEREPVESAELIPGNQQMMGARG